MSTKSSTSPKKLNKKAYEKELERLQAELVDMQQWVVETGARVVIIMEGRDAAGKYRPVWFKLAGDDPEPLAFFAGIHVRARTSVRKVKTGMETIDVFAFLTTEPNAEVGAVHPKAMPVILTQSDEIEAWMTAPWETAKALQRPLPDGALSVIDT